MDESMSTDDGPVTYERVGDVAVVRLDDGKANALSHAVIDAVDAAVDRATGEAKALALIGRPGKFSAGFDLKVMTAGPQQARDLLGSGARLGLKLFTAPLPVVFGVTGHGLAMGGILLTTADWRVGAEGPFKIGLNEVAIGMPVPRFGVELCRDRLDPAWFTRCVQHAELLGPLDAVAAGFLDEAVAADGVEARALEVAAHLGQTCTQPAFAATRRNMRGELASRMARELDEDLSAFSVG